MIRQPIKIATTQQLERSAREAGFETHRLAESCASETLGSLQQRTADGPVYRAFLEKHDIDLVLDFNAEALTLVPASGDPGKMSLTTADLGIPYAAIYLDPVTSTMEQMSWADRWHLLENNTWIKCIPDLPHAEELKRLGVSNVTHLPMAAVNEDFDTSPAPKLDTGPPIAFMGHPASSWFRSPQGVLPGQLLAGLTVAAVRADMPDLSFHKIYYDLHAFAQPPGPGDDAPTRTSKALDFFNQKFIYNAYLAVKQRDRFARFLKLKLGDAFELIGDYWEANYGLKHSPRIWDMKVLHERMRCVPISLNLTKGNFETGLNIRHYEITAFGGFMLTYELGELSDLFAVGKECAVFHDEHDLLEKIAYYLDHPKERREIAEAGQRRTLAEHLYSHRITTLVNILHEGGVLPKKPTSTNAQPTWPKIHVQGVTESPAGAACTAQ